MRQESSMRTLSDRLPGSAGGAWQKAGAGEGIIVVVFRRVP